jgi:hypothetical protein
MKVRRRKLGRNWRGRGRGSDREAGNYWHRISKTAAEWRPGTGKTKLS